VIRTGSTLLYAGPLAEFCFLTVKIQIIYEDFSFSIKNVTFKNILSHAYSLCCNIDGFVLSLQNKILFFFFGKRNYKFFSPHLVLLVREKNVDVKRSRELQGFLDAIRRGQEQVLQRKERKERSLRQRLSLGFINY
jgi:hypothetical protein